MNKWNSKRIAFISILIAMSISFVIIGTRFAGITSFPSFKLSIAGLPIKIIGFIFGPIIGFIIGFITDIISFVFIPAFYYPLYSIALGVSGMVPGLAAIFFNYFYKKVSKENSIKKINNKKMLIYYEMKLALSKNQNTIYKKYKNKYQKLENKIDLIKSWNVEKYQLNLGLFSSLAILAIVLIGLVSLFIFIPQESIDAVFKDKGILRLISDKKIFITIIALGIVTSMSTLVIARFKMKEKSFLEFVPIVTFVILTEYINIPIIAFADFKSLKIPFVASMIASLATSIIKIWFNLVIITFAIKIVLPLINKKTFNGY